MNETYTKKKKIKVWWPEKSIPWHRKKRVGEKDAPFEKLIGLMKSSRRMDKEKLLFHLIREHGGRIDDWKLGDGGGSLKEEGRKNVRTEGERRVPIYFNYDTNKIIIKIIILSNKINNNSNIILTKHIIT